MSERPCGVLSLVECNVLTQVAMRVLSTAVTVHACAIHKLRKFQHLSPVLCLRGCPAVIVANELRSHSVNKAFMDVFSATHTVKRMPAGKLDDEYQHPLIHVYICKKKKTKKVGWNWVGPG